MHLLICTNIALGKCKENHISRARIILNSELNIQQSKNKLDFYAVIIILLM